MDLDSKPLTVHFFSVETDPAVMRRFCGAFRSLLRNTDGTDVVNLARSRYILKCIALDKKPKPPLLFWSAVKERNTWQVRVKRDGLMTSLQNANSLVGDPSFYKLDPDQGIVAAFSTYTSTGYLRSMCNSVFRRLLPRSSSFSIDYLSDDNKISEIRSWDYYSRIAIKLDTTSIPEDGNKPDLIEALLSLRDAFGSSTVSVTLDGGPNRLPKHDVTEAINYLSSSDSCQTLRLEGGMYDEEERTLPINLTRAFVRYRTTLSLQPGQSSISPEDADRILSDAFANTPLPTLAT